MQWFRVHLRAGRLLIERGRREVVFLLAGDRARLRARLGGAGLGVSGACDRDRLAVRYPRRRSRRPRPPGRRPSRRERGSAPHPEPLAGNANEARM